MIASMPPTPSVWLLAVGTLGALLLTPLRSRLTSVGSIVAILVGVANAIVFALATKHRAVFGHDVWWLDDDMMISLRYARNCAAGDGLVWTVGQHVEGYTNFGWTLLAVPLHLVLPPDHVALAVIALDTLALGWLILEVHRLARDLGGDEVAALVAALGLATFAPLLHWTVGGGEAVPLALLCTMLARRVARRLPLSNADGVLFAVAVLLRADAAVAAGMLLLARSLHADRRGMLVRVGAIAAGLPLLHVAFRLLYYGELLPNTYWLKATGWDAKGATGVRYVAAFLPSMTAWLVAAPWSLVGRRHHLGLAAALVAQLAYVAHVGGDELPMYRFVLPVVPILMALAVHGAQRMAHLLPALSRAATLAPVLLLGLSGWTYGCLPGQIPDLTSRRADAEWGNVMVGMLLQHNTAKEARIAHLWAGAAAYFSDRPAIDMLGKCDPRIARSRAHAGLNAPGHNKYDFDISLADEPDVVVGGIGAAALNDSATLASFERNDYRAFADLYRHPRFQREYARQLVGGGPYADPAVRLVSTGWHGIFVRAGSKYALPAERWTSPRP